MGSDRRLGMSKITLLIAHASREEKSNRDFLRLVDVFSKKNKETAVVGAFLELAKPLIPQGIDRCVEQGASDIFVVPLMFFEGRHVKEDIPKQIDEGRLRHPGVHFHYAGAMANDPAFLEFLEIHIRSGIRENP